MDATAIATIVAAGVAAVASLIAVWLAQRSLRASQLQSAETSALRFREPLLQAAFNLQTRLYNIARNGFLRKFQDSTRPGDREYTVDNTLYLVGQYLCWIEIVRRESQFLDPRSREVERAVADQIEAVRDAFASSEGELPTPLRVFRGQQRAIGEVMLQPVKRPQPGYPRWDCMGYAEFSGQFHQEPLSTWFQPLVEDLELLRRDAGAGQERLVAVQHELLGLVELLDPEAIRTSGQLRERL